MQKASAGSRRIFAHARNLAQLQKFVRMREISSSCRNFRSCAKFRAAAGIFAHCANFFASYFQPRTTPFCIFSNFTLDVTLMSSYVYVISFVTEHYISSVKLVANQSIFQYRDETLVPVFPFFFFSPIFFHFLSFSRHPNTP